MEAEESQSELLGHFCDINFVSVLCFSTTLLKFRRKLLRSPLRLNSIETNNTPNQKANSVNILLYTRPRPL